MGCPVSKGVQKEQEEQRLTELKDSVDKLSRLNEEERKRTQLLEIQMNELKDKFGSLFGEIEKVKQDQSHEQQQLSTQIKSLKSQNKSYKISMGLLHKLNQEFYDSFRSKQPSDNTSLRTPPPKPPKTTIPTLISSTSKASSDEIETVKIAPVKFEPIHSDNTPIMSKKFVESDYIEIDAADKYIMDSAASLMQKVHNWKNTIKLLLSQKRLMEYALSQTRHTLGSYAELKQFIRNSPTDIEIEKVWIIYVWITHNIDHDVSALHNMYVISHLVKSDALTTGIAMCGGYTSMLADLCREVNIECRIVNGYGKDPRYVPGDKFTRMDHSWNSVRIFGEWHFIEATWGAGLTNENLKFEKKFQPYYFMTPPEVFIYEHFSNDNQQLPKNVLLTQFEAQPLFTLDYFLMEVSFVSDEDVYIRNTDNPFKIRFSGPENMIMSAQLLNGKNAKLERATLVQKNVNSGVHEVAVSTPRDGKYTLKVLAAIFEGKHECVAKFSVDTKNIKKKNVELVEPYYSDHIQDRCYLYEPIAYEVTRRRMTLFKVYSKAKHVVLTDADGNMTYFDEDQDEENLWLLSAEIFSKGIISLKFNYEGDSFEAGFTFKVV